MKTWGAMIASQSVPVLGTMRAGQPSKFELLRNVLNGTLLYCLAIDQDSIPQANLAVEHLGTMLALLCT